MNFANGDRLSLIQRITGKIDAFGFESTRPVVQKSIEKPKPIHKPLDLSHLIEHTLLKPEATSKDILRLCDEARQFHFRGVCVNPVFVKEVQKQLTGTDCSVITVVGFPLGANITATKVEEMKHVIELGANEVDMVIPIGALKDGDYRAVYQDIRAVVKSAGQIPVKVIIETGLLEETEKIAACLLAERAGAAFVKTSTGFSVRGATVEDVKLMRTVVGNKICIKAAGGIRDFQTARALVEAG
ncbi:MAG TPA: deoxyribose-phosphate aldolase, partial [Candidatus Wunengus sp. YC61]|uniref:deoxyribose-phosphate aldolase n=1 Tax=Candidatus Wunengus sp. YC61 TaxID=3367698 RepID=UPI0040275685